MYEDVCKKVPEIKCFIGWSHDQFIPKLRNLAE